MEDVGNRRFKITVSSEIAHNQSVASPWCDANKDQLSERAQPWVESVFDSLQVESFISGYEIIDLRILSSGHRLTRR